MELKKEWQKHMDINGYKSFFHIGVISIVCFASCVFALVPKVVTAQQK